MAFLSSFPPLEKILVSDLENDVYIKIKKEYYNNAEHSYGILFDLPDALLFTFQDYNTVRKKFPNEDLIPNIFKIVAYFHYVQSTPFKVYRH